ncbi:MAG: M24 family metallopeptidase, partial [Erysipelotrichaceae bacterium]|nr:M24 family metallopeptidase [Erysipelotrichaceae bacterium]
MRTLVEQNQIKDEILAQKLDILEDLMKETGTDAWLIACREYNEDPMFFALTPTGYPTARRLSVLLLALHDGKLEKISLCRPDEALEQFYTRDYNPAAEGQYEALIRNINRLNPKNIAINVSDHYAYTDGLTVGVYRELMNHLPKDITDKFVSSDEIGIRYLETRSPKEREIYPEVMETAIRIIYDAFSDDVITPGVTTCRDVMNFMEQQVNNLGLTFWFPATIDLQRHDGMHGEDTVIERGDLLHCDFGINYMNLCTDTQRLCYVLKEDETEIPEELLKAFARNNRFQDIVRETMKIGKTGNDVFTEAVAKGKEEGLRPFLYTHPLGFHGHAAGPTIGLWSDQNPIPVKG